MSMFSDVVWILNVIYYQEDIWKNCPATWSIVSEYIHTDNHLRIIWITVRFAQVQIIDFQFFTWDLGALPDWQCTIFLCKNLY